MEKSMPIAIMAVIISVLAIISAVVAVLPKPISAGTVGTNELADNSVIGDKVADNAITLEKLSPDVIVTLENIADNSITSAKIADGTIVDADIAAAGISRIAGDAVSGSKIQDGTIHTEDIATGGVTSDDILDGTVGAADIENGAITAAKMGKIQAYAENGYEMSVVSTGSWTWETSLSITITATQRCDILVIYDQSIKNNTAGAQVNTSIVHNEPGDDPGVYVVEAQSTVNCAVANNYQSQFVHYVEINAPEGTHIFRASVGTPTGTMTFAKRHLTVLVLPTG